MFLSDKPTKIQEFSLHSLQVVFGLSQTHLEQDGFGSLFTETHILLAGGLGVNERGHGLRHFAQLQVVVLKLGLPRTHRSFPPCPHLQTRLLLSDQQPSLLPDLVASSDGHGRRGEGRLLQHRYRDRSDYLPLELFLLAVRVIPIGLFPIDSATEIQSTPKRPFLLGERARTAAISPGPFLDLLFWVRPFIDADPAPQSLRSSLQHIITILLQLAIIQMRGWVGGVQGVDEERVRVSLLASREEQEKPEERIKRGVNINLFREDTRRQQRDFHQQNHEYLKMCGIMVRSSFDENKFKYIGESNRKANNFAKGSTNAKNVRKQQPLVHVSLDNVQFSCSLIPSKFPIKDLYQLFPLHRESIIFQSHDCLSSEFIFFLYEHENQAADLLRYKLESTIEEGILSEFKSSISKAFKNISYFDYLYFINRKAVPPRENNPYPLFINTIAAANSAFLLKLEEDQKELFNRDHINVSEEQTCQRVVICQDGDIGDNGQNMCFQTLDEYSQYKRMKSIDFKSQKIFEKDAVINTNIRNIISTEKIYMVEIIEEVKSYIQLSQECQGTAIMGRVYDHLVNKADQYLRLLCGYTDSKILTVYNIDNYQEKIYSFLERSVRCKKPLRKIPPELLKELLKEFPVLEIWFKLPDFLLGYSREELHQTFYQLMQAIIVFEQKMKANELYESLKIRRTGIKYLPK